MIPGSLAIITVFFDESERGKAIGTWSCIFSYYNCSRTGTWWMANRRGFMAMDILYKYSNRYSGSVYIISKGARIKR